MLQGRYSHKSLAWDRSVLAIKRPNTAVIGPYAPAQFNLGLIYEKGLGVSRNLVLSYMLFSLAEKEITPKSADDSARVAGLLTPEEIEEGNALAAQWKVGMPLPS